MKRFVVRLSDLYSTELDIEAETAEEALKKIKRGCIVQTGEICKNCCHNQNGRCSAFILFSERKKYGTDKCPEYIDKNTIWSITVYKDKE